MATTSPATFGLLGLLATRSYSGYELTQQVQRSLRFTWPTSEGHLYREQRRLVALGWVTAEEEPAGRRTRKRYTITPAGRRALAAWQASPPEEPHLQIEGLLRVFFGDHTGPEQLATTMRATAAAGRSMRGELEAFVDEYVADGGPLEMLEAGLGGPGGRCDHHGRPMFPERLHVVAVAVDALTRLLATLEDAFAEAADEVGDWPSTTDPTITPATRRRLEAIRDRAGGADPDGADPGGAVP